MIVSPLLALLGAGAALSLMGASGPEDGGYLLWGVLAAIIMIPLEAGLTSWLGGAPGKLLFGIRVVDAQAAFPRFRTALSRTWKVWFRGFGLGVPIVFLVCWIVALVQFRAKGITSWDRDCGTSVLVR